MGEDWKRPGYEPRIPAKPSRGPPSDELVREAFDHDLPTIEEEDVVYLPALPLVGSRRGEPF